jgi:hypothetical protein
VEVQEDIKKWCLNQIKLANFEVLAASVAEEFVFLGYGIKSMNN